MATMFLVSNPLPHSHIFTFPSLKAPTFPNSPALCHVAAGRRKLTVVTRAGPSTNSYIFAFALPFSLLAITIFTSLRIGNKLDQDFLQEMAMNEAIMEADDDDDEDDKDDDMETSLQEEPALPRARNRPKREA